jgi:hypothetical protein
MKALLNKAWIILAAAAISCSLVSCELTQREFDRFGDIDPPENRGALIIRLTTGVPDAATLTPPVSMEIYSFDIRGEGPDGESFSSPGIEDLEWSESSLAPGEWTITVDALNENNPNDPESNGTVIASGQTTVTIIPNVVVTAQIEVRPIDDPEQPGTLYVAVFLTKSTIAGPNVQATLKAAGAATANTLIFTEHPPGNPDTIDYTGPMAGGYYILTIRFLSGTDLIWGTAEAVRIIAGETTSLTYQAN